MERMSALSISVGGDGGSSHPLFSDQTLHGYFEAQVVPKHGGKIAVQNADNPTVENLTFNQLNATANQLARGLLQRLKSAPADQTSATPRLVAVRFDPNIDLIASILAILKVFTKLTPYLAQYYM